MKMNSVPDRDRCARPRTKRFEPEMDSKHQNMMFIIENSCAAAKLKNILIIPNRNGEG